MGHPNVPLTVRESDMIDSTKTTDIRTMTRPALLTPKEVAEQLNVCTKTLLKLRRLGLRYVQLTLGSVRYKQEDIDEFLENRQGEECHSDRRIPHTGNTTFKSGVVDFTEAVRLYDLKTQKPLKRPRARFD